MRPTVSIPSRSSTRYLGTHIPITMRQRELTFQFISEPNDVNFGGKVHGGAVMKWIDQTAYACACDWAGGYCVTVYVGGIRFLAPVQIGHVVRVEAKLIRTGTSSMHIAVNVRSRTLEHEQWTLTTHCIIVFAALDDQGHPREVPAWEPLTEKDRRLHTYASRLMELRKNIELEMRPFIGDDLTA
jgi:acyl-CoA hydrolase